MNLLDVYNKFPVQLQQGTGMQLTDDQGNNYLDFYGGHGVISVGHSHPKFISAITAQLNRLAFYSNAFENDLQNNLAQLLGEQSGYKNYQLFMSNSGAEANENALKVAKFCNKRNKVLALKGAFHGRTAGALAITDNNNIKTGAESAMRVDFIDLDDKKTLTQKLESGDYAAFFIEGIQGVNGVWSPNTEFWQLARLLCSQTNTLFIADEIQSGYGRSGKFFAHQHHNIMADIVTTAKGMGNGFPVAATIIHPKIKLKKGALGTTFGGGHLACAAAISVLQIIKSQQLIANALQLGNYLKNKMQQISGVKQVRGQGLMLGINFYGDAKQIQKELLQKHGIITGFSNPDTLRILPPLSIEKEHADAFLYALGQITENLTTNKAQN